MILILKKGIEIESQKLCKQVRDKRNGPKVLLENRK